MTAMATRTDSRMELHTGPKVIYPTPPTPKMNKGGSVVIRPTASEVVHDR